MNTESLLGETQVNGASGGLKQNMAPLLADSTSEPTKQPDDLQKEKTSSIFQESDICKKFGRSIVIGFFFYFSNFAELLTEEELKYSTLPIKQQLLQAGTLLLSLLIMLLLFRIGLEKLNYKTLIIIYLTLSIIKNIVMTIIVEIVSLKLLPNYYFQISMYVVRQIIELFSLLLIAQYYSVRKNISIGVIIAIMNLNLQLGQNGWNQIIPYSYAITAGGIAYQVWVLFFIDFDIQYEKQEDSFSFFESEIKRIQELVESDSQKRTIYMVLFGCLISGFVFKFWESDLGLLEQRSKNEIDVSVAIGISNVLGPLLTQILISFRIKDLYTEFVFLSIFGLMGATMLFFLTTGIQVEKDLYLGLTAPLAIFTYYGVLVFLMHKYKSTFKENHRILTLYACSFTIYQLILTSIQSTFQPETVFCKEARIMGSIVMVFVVLCQGYIFYYYNDLKKFYKPDEEYFTLEGEEHEMQKYGVSSVLYKDEDLDESTLSIESGFSSYKKKSLKKSNQITSDKQKNSVQQNNSGGGGVGGTLLHFQISYEEFEKYFKKIEVVCHSRDNTTVSKYINKLNGTQYAVKQIYIKSKEELEEKKGEIETMKNISNMEYVVKIHHFVEAEFKNLDSYQLFIIMDLAVCSLKDEIKMKKKLDTEVVKTMAHNLIFQLAELFEKAQISHRDIKPHNILKFSDGQYKLADFGEAKIHSLQTLTHSQITVCGTEKYLSPELKSNYDQIKDNENSNKKVTYCDQQKSDVYSLGLTLLEAITLENIKDFNTYQGRGRVKLAIQSIEDKELQKLVSNMLIFDAGKRMTFTFLKSFTNLSFSSSKNGSGNSSSDKKKSNLSSNNNSINSNSSSGSGSSLNSQKLKNNHSNFSHLYSHMNKLLQNKNNPKQLKNNESNQSSLSSNSQNAAEQTETGSINSANTNNFILSSNALQGLISNPGSNTSIIKNTSAPENYYCNNSINDEEATESLNSNL